MDWIKKGLIFTVDKNHDWMQTHAQVPLVDDISDGRLRIYFGTRDKFNRTSITYIEVEAENPQNILYIHDISILSLGNPGAFDEDGIMPSWIVTFNNKKYLYYLGWNKGSSVSYRLANGLAISEDDGQKFQKISEGPIMDRSIIDPYSVSNQSILIENEVWKMWYMSFVKWEVVNGIPEPYYLIKYGESKDGIQWETKGQVCIDFKSPDECGISRPCVLKEDGIYKMWYSFRGIKNYRTDKKNSYRIGYAESEDGIHWIRKDEQVGIDVSENGWDSEMIAYPFVFNVKDKKYMFYNGNGFGKSGFGYAVMNSE